RSLSTLSSSLATQGEKPQSTTAHHANTGRPVDCVAAPQVLHNSTYPQSLTQSGPVHRRLARECVSLGGGHLQVPPPAARWSDHGPPVSACWRTKCVAPSLGQLF